MDMERNKTDSPLISVIVPVYKVEKYLRRCVDSILAQTYQNFELILVDDGSPDQCGVICDEYAKNDDRITVIHQNNQGQAAARNNAVKLAKGVFVSYIDSDDFVEEDCLAYLLFLQQKSRADLTIGGFAYLYEGKEPSARDSDNETDVLMDAETALIRMNYNKGYGAMPWAKLYRKELVARYPFPEGQIYEDLATLYKIVGDCEKIAYGNRRIYYWLQRAGSTMRMKFDERQMAAMEAAEAQLHYIEREYPNALDSAKYRYTAKAVELIAVCFNSGANREVFHRLQTLMNRYADDVLRDSQAKPMMKMRIRAVKKGYYPARIVIGAHELAKKHLA